MDPVNNERFAERAVEPSSIVLHLGDASKHNTPDGQLRHEIIVLLVTEFVKPGSHRNIVGHLDEAASFRDVRHVAKCKIALLKRESSTVF